MEVQKLDILNDELRTNMDSVRHSLAVRLDSLQVHVIDPGALQYASAMELDGIFGSNGQSERSDEEILKSRELIEELVVSIISDYGATLASLSNDEFLKVTLNWRDRHDILPEETRFFIKKSELDRDQDVTITSKSRS